MKYKNAYIIAEEFQREMAPFCNRIEIAGSIRRQKSSVKDIEIVCIPKLFQKQDLFGECPRSKAERVLGFVATLKKYRINKGDPKEGKYVQLLHPKGILIDVFIVTEETFGKTMVLRTGPTEFSKFVFGHHIRKLGYHLQDGMLVDAKGVVFDTRKEKTVFRVIGLPQLPPNQRHKFRRLLRGKTKFPWI